MCIGSPSHSSTEKGPFKRFVDLPNGTSLQETIDRFAVQGCPMCAGAGGSLKLK